MTNVPIPIPSSFGELLSVDAKVIAGFPSPAQDHAQRRIDLNDVLVLNPLSTFLFSVEGDSMEGHHIFAGDRVIVDRSVEPLHGRVVLACVDGEFTVKQLYRRDDAVLLLAGNPKYQAIAFHEGQEMSIWGVVTWTLRSILHRVSSKS